MKAARPSEDTTCVWVLTRGDTAVAATLLASVAVPAGHKVHSLRLGLGG